MVLTLTFPLSSLAPYERRVIELLRNGKDKRARKFSKKKVWHNRRLLFLAVSREARD